jgi:hypothetical protein
MIGKMLLVAALALAWVHGLVASSRADEKKADKPAPYVHVVIFHLKKDAPANAAEDLITDAHKMLAKIPTVRELRVGRPAEKATPDFAKKDYQVGLVIFFDDFDGLKTYLDHPLHLKYVEKHLKYVDEKSLGVYDFINQMK